MPTILIVDDLAFCRSSLSRLLELKGYPVTQAIDGVDALRSIEVDPPDLILLDMVMPRMGGLEFLNIVRANPRFRSLPIFLMTGVHDVETVARARQLGIQEYLFKGDVSFMGILELVKKHLGEPFTRPRRGRKPRIPIAVTPRPVGGTTDRSKSRANCQAPEFEGSSVQPKLKTPALGVL